MTADLRGELRGDLGFRTPGLAVATLMAGVPWIGARRRVGKTLVDGTPFFSVHLNWSNVWKVALLSKILRRDCS